MKIAAQLYNCRDFAQSPEGIKSCLQKIKTLGFDIIQISGLGPYDPVQLSDWVTELGLEVCLTHVPWSQLVEPPEFKKLIAEHKMLNCPFIGLGSRPREIFANTYEGWTDFIKSAVEITQKIKAEGFSFCYHHHDFEFEKWNDTTALDRLINEVPGMLFILDTFWIQAGGANPLKYIKKLEGRVPVIHFKDFRIVNGARQFAEIGRGNLDWDEIIPQCKAAGISYAAIEQDRDWLLDPFDSLDISRKFLLNRV